MNYQDHFLKICELVKKYSKADDFVLNYLGSKNNLTRFADNRLTQNIENEFEEIYITTYMGKKKATLQTANLTEVGIKELIKKAESIAHSSMEDVEYLPSLSPDNQNISDNLDPELLDLSPLKRAGIVKYALDQAQKSKTITAGIFRSSVDHTGIYTKNNLQKFHIQSGCLFSSTFDKNNEQANSQANSTRFHDLDYHKAIDEGLRDVEVMQKKISLPPGKYDVLMSSKAYSELNLMGASYGMDRKAYDKGYSAYNNKIDTLIAPAYLNLYLDPYHQDATCRPFDKEGLGHQKISIIENGFLRNLQTSRFWAKEHNLTPFYLCNLIMDGSDLTEADLISKIERGFYIKDVWYIRMVKPEDLTLTGMTRNALFYIEDGMIKSGSTHYRWNDSPMNIFNRIKEVGKCEKTQVYHFPCFVPPVIISDFNLSSATTF